MIKTLKNLRNNKGLTFIELIIAFAILAIVLVTVTLVITTSSNTYSALATNINLQYESQMTMNQIQEYVIDSNAYIAVSSDSNNLYIFNKKNDMQFEAYKFSKDTGSDKLYFYKKDIVTSNFTPADSVNFDFDDSGQLMSSFVSAFSAAVSETSVSITIHYDTGGKTYIGRQTIALRNEVQNISSNVPQG